VSGFLILVTSNCGQNSTMPFYQKLGFKTYEDFDKNYAPKLPFHSTDSVVARIAADIPDPLKGWMCERTYYSFPPEGSNVVLFDYIDKIEQAFPHDSIRTFVQLTRGNMLMYAGKLDSAEQCLHRCYDLSVGAKRWLRASDAQSSLGQMAVLRGDYPEAIRLMNIAYQASKAAAPYDGGRLFEAMAMIGKTYRNIEDYESAKQWHLLALKQVQNDTNSRGHLVRIFSYLAYDYLHNRQLDSAKSCIDSAIACAERFKVKYETTIRQVYRGDVAVAQGFCEAAMTDYVVASRDSNFFAEPLVVARIQNGWGDAQHCLGHLDSALAHYNLAMVAPDTLMQAKILLKMASVYEQQGKFPLAIEYNRRGLELHNRILTTRKTNAIERMKIRNESEMKLQKILTQQKTMRLWAVILILSFAFLLALALAAIRRQRQQRIIMAQEVALLETRERLKTVELGQAQERIEVQSVALEKSAQLLQFKNQIIKTLELQLDEQQQAVADTASSTHEAAPTPLAPLRSMRILTTDDWVRFRALFDGHFPHFSYSLQSRFPKLTNAELRLMLLIKAGFEVNEMAAVLGISNQSVYTSRYRLRKKIDLTEESDLEAFIQAFE
jgi:tetratricopeptide (TPR) repeat protein/DNA-binding CsgD family transcriptional regulator